ncbi:hypothetical protein [Streptomyces sp. NPDC023588]|uniref:hypothetical protein n=1 Tax=Streptomyces sp. NPDC023588 TaxID=3154907 RepID=UPI0033DB9117
MPENEETDLGAIQGTEGGPTTPNLDGVPVTEVKPEDMGTLSLRYVDGLPQLVVSGGKALPAGLMVVDESGAAVANYTASPGSAPQSRMVINHNMRAINTNR